MVSSLLELLWSRVWCCSEVCIQYIARTGKKQDRTILHDSSVYCQKQCDITTPSKYMTTRPKISVVVCTHNRDRFLKRCLLSLLDQSLDPEQYEVLVVDNASTDTTSHICHSFKERQNFRYVFEPVPGLSQARNTGWKQARGEYIAYIDDDAWAVKEWLEFALDGFAVSPAPDWVGGPVTLEWEIPPPRWLTEDYYGALGWVDWGGLSRFVDPQREWLVGCNSLFNSKMLEQLGGFDTRLGRKKNSLLSGEEVQLHHRLITAGGSIYYHSGVRVHHFVEKERLERSYFYRRYYWGGITDYIMAKTLRGVVSQIATEKSSGIKRLARLAANSVKSVGLCVPEDQMIRSRIYMSYVSGQMMGMIRYGRHKIDTD